MRRKPVRNLCAVLVVLGFAATACGSDDDDDNTAAEPPTTASAAASTSDSAAATTPQSAGTTPVETVPQSAAGTTPAETVPQSAAVPDSTEVSTPTGEPIELMMIVALTTQPQYPERVSATKAAADAINAKGGVGGRPITITTCDSRNDAAEEANCAQQLASSAAIAVIAAHTQRSTVVADTTIREQMASIGPVGVGATDLLQETTSSFPLSVPATSLLACPAALAAAGATKIGALTYEGAGAERLVGGAQAVIANVPGTTFTGLTTVSFAATDMAGPLQTAIDNGADGLILGLGEALAIATMKANNGRVKTCTSDGIISPQNLQDLGAAAEGWSIMSSVPPIELLSDSGGMGEQFVAEVDAYYEASGDEGAAPANRRGGALVAWMAVHAFAMVAEDLPEITRQTVFDAFTNTTDLEFPGLLPKPIDFTAFRPVPTLARLFASEYRLYSWSTADQNFTPADEYFDVVELLTGG